jgi:hypothetical protein
MSNIQFNPNLPPNDSLEPWEIQARGAARNQETRELTEKAYLVGDVPPSAAERAAEHSSVSRQTPEAKKARRDARTWWKAKNSTGVGDDES